MTDPHGEHITEATPQQLTEAEPRTGSIPARAVDKVTELALLLPRVDQSIFRTGNDIHCPYCFYVVESQLVPLYSGLGPSLIECANCRRALLSHRRDWADMTTTRRLWFVMVSLWNVLSAAALGGAIGLVAFRLDGLKMAGDWAWGVAGAWAFGAAAFTFVRLHRSRRRTAAQVREPYRVSLWAFECGLKWKVTALLLLLTAALAALLHILSNS